MPENTLALKKKYKIAHSLYSLDYSLFLHVANNKKHHDIYGGRIIFYIVKKVFL